MATADLSQLTAIIPAGEDRKSLRRLVRSLRRVSPDLQTIIAAEGVESPLRGYENSIRLPAGAGRAAACNAMLARLRTRYFLMIDERCEISKDTQLDKLLEMLVSDRLDVAAGDLVGCSRLLWFFTRRKQHSSHGTLELAGDHLTLHRGHRSEGDGFLWCDLVQNFFVARTEKVRSMGGWDPELKNDELVEYFVRAHRQGLRVGLVPEVKARIWSEGRASQHSELSPNMKTLAVAKMGLTRMTDFDGQVIKAPRRAMAA